jgi:hypothetical protein
MVPYLAPQLVAVDSHAVPPILNFLLLFWHEYPDIGKPKYKYGSQQTDQIIYCLHSVNSNWSVLQAASYAGRKTSFKHCSNLISVRIANIHHMR